MATNQVNKVVLEEAVWFLSLLYQLGYQSGGAIDHLVQLVQWDKSLQKVIQDNLGKALRLDSKLTEVLKNKALYITFDLVGAEPVITINGPGVSHYHDFVSKAWHAVSKHKLAGLIVTIRFETQ